MSSSVAVTVVRVADSTPPTAPAGVSVASTTIASATVVWAAATDNVGVSGYRLYRDGTLVTSVTAATFPVQL